VFIDDFYFYLTAVPAVLIYGMAKGGLGGAAGAVAVPLMSLTTEPIQAAAILLPIIFVMDIHVIKLFWGKFDADSLKIIVPAALLGVVIGALLLGILPTGGIKLLLGVIAIVFCVDFWTRRARQQPRSEPGPWSGRFWAVIAGITSTHIHAGGPAISVYLLAKSLDKIILVGTFGVFFFVLNFAKLIPYTLLGQFDAQNLMTALVLMPLAPVGVRLGYLFLHRFEQAKIYTFIYGLLFLTGIKLLADGLGLVAA
jgi:uncharacterized membrane protein YfcA